VLAFSTLVGSGYLSACAPLEGEAAGDWSTGSQDEGGVEELQDKVGPTTQYEAESRCAAQGCSQSAGQAGFTGSGFMDFGGNGTWIEWNNISASLAGDYQLSFRYANGAGGNRQAPILVKHKGQTYQVELRRHSVRGPMTVGYHTQDPSGSGAWDCLKIYHVALTPSQITAEACPVKTN